MVFHVENLNKGCSDCLINNACSAVSIKRNSLSQENNFVYVLSNQHLNYTRGLNPTISRKNSLRSDANVQQQQQQQQQVMDSWHRLNKQFWFHPLLSLFGATCMLLSSLD